MEHKRGRLRLPRGYRLVKRGRFHVGDRVGYYLMGRKPVWETVGDGDADLLNGRMIQDGWYEAVARRKP